LVNVCAPSYLWFHIRIWKYELTLCITDIILVLNMKQKTNGDAFHFANRIFTEPVESWSSNPRSLHGSLPGYQSLELPKLQSHCADTLLLQLRQLPCARLLSRYHP
jgi:hypothetical protein